MEDYKKPDGIVTARRTCGPSGGSVAKWMINRPDDENGCRVQWRLVRAKISLNPRCHLQHLQRPAPFHFSKDAPCLRAVRSMCAPGLISKSCWAAAWRGESGGFLLQIVADIQLGNFS
jgi:hypothetical protein